MTDLITLGDWEERLDVGAGFSRCSIQDITCDSAQPCFGRVTTDDIRVTRTLDPATDSNGLKTINVQATIPHPEDAMGIEYTWYVAHEIYHGDNVNIKGRGTQIARLSFSKGGCSISKDVVFDFD